MLKSQVCFALLSILSKANLSLQVIDAKALTGRAVTAVELLRMSTAKEYVRVFFLLVSAHLDVLSLVAITTSGSGIASP
jgi:hypothetical protein